MPNSEPTGTSNDPVIRNSVHCLAHVPDLVTYGSKPRREIAKDASNSERLTGSLRSFDEAMRYPPNQTVIGYLSPGMLAEIPRPWFAVPDSKALPETAPVGPFGEILPQELFFGLLKSANVLKPPLVELTEAARESIEGGLAAHPVLAPIIGLDFASGASLHNELEDGMSLAMWSDGILYGCVRRDSRAEGREDDNLDAYTLLEGLCTKASAAFALQWLIHREGIAAEEIECGISCGEEAAGDRYQRGDPGRTRTCNPRLRRPMLYPIELRGRHLEP